MKKFLIFLCFMCVYFNLYAEGNSSKFLEFVQNGNISKAEELLKNGADINAQNSNGATALMTAVYNNDISMVKMLMKYNPNVNIQDKSKNSPFLYAGARGYLDILKLIYKKADTRNVVNIYGGNALIPACEKGHLETVIFLLENTDINVNHINNLSWTALLEVTILGNDNKNYQEIVKVLLKHGADKNIKDNSGKTALDYAKERNLKNIERLLL